MCVGQCGLWECVRQPCKLLLQPPVAMPLNAGVKFIIVEDGELAKPRCNIPGLVIISIVEPAYGASKAVNGGKRCLSKGSYK